MRLRIFGVKGCLSDLSEKSVKGLAGTRFNFFLRVENYRDVSVLTSS